MEITGNMIGFSYLNRKYGYEQGKETHIGLHALHKYYNHTCTHHPGIYEIIK